MVQGLKSRDLVLGTRYYIRCWVGMLGVGHVTS